ncbi:MAG: pilus assembly protein PilC [Planctomycetes bacterium DG_23]|nr:MAG: pilus assembly protein PilC [Planctomycetes bacterium DG_23]
MPLFVFEGTDQQGQTVRDEVEAETTEEAVAKIRDMGYWPTNIREKARKRGVPSRPGARKKSFAIGRVRRKDLTTFTRQLSTLQDAGLPILRSLRILEGQLRPGVLKNSLMGVQEEVEGGATLSEALAKFPRAFDRLYVNMVRAGEAGGVLETVLNRLAEFREKAWRLRKKIIGSMVYPVTVITFATLIVTGIMLFIVPRFEEIFLDFEVELPALTRFIVGTARSLRFRWFYFVIPLLVLPIGYKLVRLTHIGRYSLDFVKLHLPLFGTIINKSVVSRFARTLGTLVASGVPILEALNITRDTCGNEVVARAMSNVHDSIREGETMEEPLRQSKVCDDMVVNMVAVGEETGELDRMLLKISDTYDDDVDAAVEGLTSLLEPLMIVILAVIVGTIVISLFMPLISLINKMGDAASG